MHERQPSGYFSPGSAPRSYVIAFISAAPSTAARSDAARSMSSPCSIRPRSVPTSSIRAPRSRTPRWCSRCRSAKDEPPPRSGFVAGLIGRLQQRQLDHLTKRQREGARTSRPSAPATSRCSSGVQPADPGERDVSGVPDYNAVVEVLPAP